MKMPAPDQDVLARRAEIVTALRAIVPGEGVIDAIEELRAYESDGLTAYRQLPMVVVPALDRRRRSRECCAIAAKTTIKVVPRGAGTSLSGGALPLADGVLLGIGKFNRILDIDYRQPLRRGAAGRHQSRHHPGGAARAAFTTRPIPPPDRLHDRRQCGREFRRRALPEIRPHHQQRAWRRDGADRRRDHAASAASIWTADGYDLLGVITGSEGLLGVITEVTVRLLQKPATARAMLLGFPTSRSRAAIVWRDIIAAGIIPGGMEMMDKPAIHAAEEFVHADYPLDVEALLIVELDGPQRGGRPPDRRVEAIARETGASHRRFSANEEERALLGRAQGGLPGGRAHLAGLFLHGRHHPAQAPSARF